MFRHPPEFSEIISVFSPNFSKKVFEHVGQLLLGTILTQGKRTVCGVLRTLGLSQIKNWSVYHQVLSRAKWSAFHCSKCLLQLLIKQFCKSNILIFGMDETMERRWGPKIKARGIYRDAVRSSKSHFVKCSGLRWICVMLLTPIDWLNRIWALPFLTVLAPSERYHKNKGKRHKTLSDWARQICLLLSLWLPDFQLIMLGDGSYAVRALLDATRHSVTWIVRFRMDGSLYDFPPPRTEGQMGRPPIKGEQQPSLETRLNDPETKWNKMLFANWYEQENKLMEFATGIAIWYRGGEPAVPIRWVLVRDPEGKSDPMAIACTDLNMDACQIIKHYLKRWGVEVTFEEVRAHLGVETQRQWSDLSIARTTPTLMALFCIITLWADKLFHTQKLTVFQTTWYEKTFPTFSDAIASVRYRIWRYQLYSQSKKSAYCEKSSFNIYEHLAFMAARAA